MNYEGESSRTLTDEQEAIEAVVSYLSEEIGDVVELDECVTQGVDECISIFHVAFVRRSVNRKVVLPCILGPNTARKRRC